MSDMIRMASFKYRASREEVIKSLVHLFDFDSDWNGDNGVGYLKDEAREVGFETNIDWFIDDHIDSFLNDDGLFTLTCEEFEVKLNDLCVAYCYLNYYSILRAGAIESGDGYVASLVYLFEL